MFGFGKKPENTEKVSVFAGKLMKMLDCPCEHFPAGSDPGVVLSKYNEAFAKREMGGYTPFIIVIDDIINRDFDDCEKTAEDLRNSRDKILASEPIDVDKWFLERISSCKENMDEYWAEIIGEIERNPGDAMTTFSGPISYTTGKTEECVLAKIPANEPWEVFAWLPFGGWNECPNTEEIMWVAKYWYEKFGAVPAVMTRDVLEFSAAPVKNEKTAAELALQQYVFCSDIVDQGLNTIGRLAGALMQSSAWYFWWD